MTESFDLEDKLALADQACEARNAIARQVDATPEEFERAVNGEARKFYLAAVQREDEADTSLPMPEFKDKVTRWFKNWREVYCAVLRERGRNHDMRAG